MQETRLVGVVRPALLFLLLFCAFPARAQRFWPDAVDTVQVVAQRVTPEEKMKARNPTAAVSYIPLGPEAPAGRDLGDLLDRSAGLHVHRYGGLGAFSLVGVRGSTPGQVRICLDGVPVSDAGEASVNLALLPVRFLDHAEIYRGPIAPSFGGPPAAGVIDLVTPRSPAVPLSLTVAGGSAGAREASGRWGAGKGPWNAFLSGEYRYTDGRYLYRSDNGTRFDPTDDRTLPRENNDSLDRAWLWKGSFAPKSTGGPDGSAVRLDYTGQFLSRENGVAGYYRG